MRSKQIAVACPGTAHLTVPPQRPTAQLLAAETQQGVYIRSTTAEPV